MSDREFYRGVLFPTLQYTSQELSLEEAFVQDIEVNDEVTVDNELDV